MKHTVWTFGLISGVVAIVMMAVTIPFIRPATLGTADFLGYTSMVLSALFVFFGIRSYRDRAVAGRMAFRDGFLVGVLITLVASACYLVAFQVMYFGVVPDFGDRFAHCMVERVVASGGTTEQVASTARQAQTLKRLYDNPAANAALTLATTVPLGVVFATISAAILRRRESR